MKNSRAFSPGHITGFFQICDDFKNPMEKGSRGAGVSVDRGVTTSVKAKPSKSPVSHIEINGNPSAQAPISQGVLAHFLEFKAGQDYLIHIQHQVDLPIGAGFGTSGAAALSLALALNDVLECSLTKLEATQIAHLVEVENRTGLGTVVAEMVGGIEIRTSPGGPGFGQVQTLPSSDQYRVVCLPFGPIPTSKHLNDQASRKRINEKGGLLTDAFQANPTVSNLMDFSRHFAEHIGLITNRVKRVLKETDRAGFTCSTAIFGENAFSLVLPEQVQDLVAIFERHRISDQEVLVMEVDCIGARVLNE
ncbi:MAG: pantoate kinase [Candidatus Thorarchaeota archaeon]